MKTIKVRFVKRGKENPEFLIQEKKLFGWKYLQKPDKTSNIKYLFVDKDKNSLLDKVVSEHYVMDRDKVKVIEYPSIKEY